MANTDMAGQDDGAQAPTGKACTDMTATEQAIAAIWRDVLGTSGFGAEDSFFALGGRSLAAMKVMAQVRKQIGAPVKLADLFRAPDLRSFAKLVDSKLPGPGQEKGGQE
jgi:aryl carrier-like protein